MTPIEGVLFDFHSTLVDQGSAAEWLGLACRRLGRRPPGPDDDVVTFLDDIWGQARAVDPENRRDTGPVAHREVYDRAMTNLPAVDTELAGALYDCLLDTWVPYEDAAPVLKSLRRNGIRVAVLSNVGIDVRPVLDRGGLRDLVDGVVLSYEVGSVKPEPEIFSYALQVLEVPAERALMVGDSWQDDAGGADLGIRTLVLPRTTGPEHGLDAVLRLVG